MLLIPSLALILLLLNVNVESGIMWSSYIFFFITGVYPSPIILICFDKSRTDGLHLLLGVGILALVGFEVLSQADFIKGLHLYTDTNPIAVEIN